MMRGLYRCVPVIGALFVLSACATTPEIPFVQTADNIHTIGLTTPGFPDGASVVLASDMGQSFGLIGALVDASMQSNRDSTFKDIVTKQNFVASDQFSQDLTAALTKDGYAVVPIAVARKDSGLLKELPAAPQPVDAYLDVAVMNYGYVAAGIGDNTPYRPFLMLQCKLIRASDKTVLMQDKIDLGFASQRWQRFVIKRQSDHSVSDRRALEVCVFVYLAEALQTGDLYIVGAEEFADYRAQLLPWSECETRLAAYCATLGIPERGADFAAALKVELTTLADQADAGFPTNSELDIDKDGTPHLKKLVASIQPKGLAEFEQEIR